ncbi:hypothetical protein LLH00_00565 [bacterium]|nr:hypothetical protein [bacterium]
MKRFFVLALLAFLALGAVNANAQQGKIYPYRFIYLHGKALEDMAQVELVRNLARTAKDHGLNGIILSAMLDRLPLEPPYNVKNLYEIKRICDSCDVELIPGVCPMGYNAPTLAWDKNLLEGLPVKDVLFEVKGGLANVVPDPAVSIPNGGFEEAAGTLPAGWEQVVKKGALLSLDSKVCKSGKNSLRVEMTDQIADLSGEFQDWGSLVSRKIPVHPGRCYRLSCWVRTQGLDGRGDVFPMLVQGANGRRLQYYIPVVPATSDGWVLAQVGFNSLENTDVTVSVGCPSGKSGKFWIDDYSIAEEGLINVIRREGAPLVVKSDKSGQVYTEGRDFARVEDPLKTLLFDHPAPAIRIIPGGYIKEGERLRVSFYNNYPIYNGQTPACISEPRYYDICRQVITLLDGIIKPKKYFFGLDELRMCGNCETCKARGLTPGQLAADCITRQRDIVKSINPDAEIFVWTDMFDPNHNAGNQHGQNYYYHVDGTFEGSWNYLPKDVIMVCWYGEVRDKSLAHFNSLGLRTLGSSSGGLDTARGWLKSLDATSGAVGIMYTTWNENFNALSQFGDLVNRKLK